MIKTHKEFLSDIWAEMRDVYEERNKQLEEVNQSKFSDKLKEQMRKEINEVFDSKIKKLKARPWYQEALESARKEWKMKHRLDRAKEAYEAAQFDYRWEVENPVKEDKWLESLRWDRDGILNALRENEKYVKIEENVKVMWYKWKKVYINLPKVWNFEWFKFDYFVSDDDVTKKHFEKKPKLKKKSYSMNDVSNLLKAMNTFMAALGCETDWNMKYENELKYWENNTDRCDAWDCLKTITWLNSWYWLSDKNEAWRKGSRAGWCCNYDHCYFDRNDRDEISVNLFLRLSD